MRCQARPLDLPVGLPADAFRDEAALFSPILRLNCLFHTLFLEGCQSRLLSHEDAVLDANEKYTALTCNYPSYTFNPAYNNYGKPRYIKTFLAVTMGIRGFERLCRNQYEEKSGHYPE
jgi:hypothetical protein